LSDKTPKLFSAKYQLSQDNKGMLWNSLMKNPVLAIGIILFSLFLYQVASKEQWGILANEKLIATPCKAALVRLVKHTPENWKLFCEGNNMAVVIDEITIPKDAANLEILMFRQLANHMAMTARLSQVDILEKVLFVRFKVIHPRMEINAMTEGQYIVKLATLETPEHIMAHLKSTVQVKITVK
jgi:hypothetical protein